MGGRKEPAGGSSGQGGGREGWGDGFLVQPSGGSVYSGEIAAQAGGLYGLRVAPQGWAELLAWMREQSGEGRLDPEAAWQRFRALAAASKHPGLGELTVRFRAAPAKDRLALAGTIAALLAPVDWPEAWDEARRVLVDALGELLLASDSAFPELGAEEELFRAGLSTLSAARDLLRAPCRREDIRTAARLCAMGNAWCSRAGGRSIEALGPRVVPEHVALARRRYAIAFATYARAARVMNDACGAVVFTGLDLELPQRGAA